MHRGYPFDAVSARHAFVDEIYLEPEQRGQRLVAPRVAAAPSVAGQPSDSTSACSSTVCVAFSCSSGG
jgi:hypothetical protein